MFKHFKRRHLRKASIHLRHYSKFKRTLRKALEVFEENSDVKFSPHYIKSARFSRGPVNLAPLFVDHDKIISYQISFGSLFREGIHKLNKWIEGNDIDDNLLSSIGSIAKFLDDKDFHESSLLSLNINNNIGDETGIATILAVHLFSELAYSSSASYMITNDYISKYKVCPCDNNCGQPVLYGNTSIGTTALWYGRPDIVLFPNGAGSSSVIVPSIENSYNSSRNFESDDVRKVEEKSELSALREKHNVRQFSTIAITFSYYQRILQERIAKRRGANLSYNPSLIPTLAVTPGSFDIYMYDTEYDIFLRNAGLPLDMWRFDEDRNEFTLDLTSILYIWLLINHLSFKPSFSKDVIDLLQENCGVDKNVSKRSLNKILRHMKMPWSTVSDMDEKLLAKAKIIELGKED